MVRIFLSIVRTIPTLVAALIATYIWGLGTMAGTVAIAVFTFAYVGKQLYELIETVDMGAYEAMEAMGAGRAQAFLAAIQPQVLPAYLSVCLFCFEGKCPLCGNPGICRRRRTRSDLKREDRLENMTAWA